MTHYWQEYAEHRTGIEVHKLLHYAHFIPVGNGRTQAYVAEHFPGWTWNELMAVWQAAGIVRTSPAGGPPACHERVKAIHFNGPTSFAVEWLDGHVTY
jgi:hypothetical protein